MLGGFPAKWNCECTERNSLSYDVFLSQLHEFIRLGVGMNFNLSPSSERRFSSALCFFVKSWKAMLDGRVKYYHVGIVARVVEALCFMDSVGSAVKPNCAISFFVVASLAVFSCQW